MKDIDAQVGAGPSRAAAAGMSGGTKLYWSLLPIPALLILIAILYFTVAPGAFYDPQWLILLGNTMFIGAVSFLVTGIAWRNYLATGRLQVLLLGCGVLLFGIGGVLAGVVRGLPGGANLNVTIYNTGALFGAAFHFMAALILLAGMAPETGAGRRRLWLGLGYGGSVLFMAVLTAVSLRGLIPPFFVQGVGPTLVRQSVLGTADLLFVFSCLVFFGTYYRNRERFLYWYAGALALTAISLTGFFLQHSVGSPIGWVGRFSQYIGGVYFLISLLTAASSAQSRGATLDEVLTTSLTGAEEKFRAAFANAAIGFAMTTPSGRFVDANPAYCAIVGYSVEELRELDFPHLIHPEDQASNMRQIRRMLAGTIADFTVENRYLRKGGQPVWVRKSVSLVRDAEGVPRWILAFIEDITAHKHAEEEVAEARRHAEEREVQLRTVVDSMTEGVYVCDGDGRPILANAAYRAGFGRAELPVYPQGFSAAVEIFDLEGRTVPVADWPLSRALRGDPVRGRELRMRYKRSGQEYIASFNAVPVFDAQGRVAMAVLTSEDISERKQADELRTSQQALKQANEMLERSVAERTVSLQKTAQRLWTLMEALPVGISFSADTTCQNISGNSTALSQFEVTAQDNLSASAPSADAPGRQLRFFKDGRLISDAELPLQRAVKENRVIPPMELEVELPSGKRWNCDASGAPVRDAEGKVFAGIAVTVDATERKKAEQRIAHLSSFPELNPLPIFETDMDGKVTYCNPAAQRQFPGLMEGGGEHPLLSNWSQVLSSIGDGGEAPIVREVEWSGRVYQQSIYHAPELHRVRAYFTDLTARKQAEQALVRAEKLAAAGRMAATVAHEINNPLAAVMNSLYLALTDAQLDPGTRQHLSTAEEQLGRLAEVTRKTLGFYREQGAPAAASLKDVLEQVLRVYDPRLRAKHIAVSTRLSGDCTVRGVVGELRQVLSNLIANSIDALPEGGKLLIHAHCLGVADHRGRLMVSVADNGSGIAAEFHAHVFEPFFTTKGDIGTGLGLWVTRELLRKNNGSIRMRSRPGVGSVFAIFLPVPTAKAAQSGA